MKKDSIKAWAQLLRIPNVFTALADVIAGALLALGRWPEGDEVLTLIRVCFASACLYSAGMVLNDFFDVEEDTRERPFRPIPSGRVKRKIAEKVGILLLASGAFLAGYPASSRCFIVALALVLAIVAYNAWLKRTSFGPATMGTCRFLNVLLGLSLFHELTIGAYWAATLVGCYIVGVTYFAKGEVGQKKRADTYAGIGLILCCYLALLSIPVYLMALSQEFLNLELRFIGLASLWAAIIAFFLIRAVLRAESAQIQMAVKACIFGLIGLDSILAYASVGPTGLLILSLLLPAIILGRFIYST